jgi:2-hydroxycyclohexanecarboxyl-CoA dehydrogenase
MKVEATDKYQVKTTIDRIVKQWGKIDVLINNIGWNKPVPFLESEESLWYRIVELNLMVTLRFCHAVLPHMISQCYGRIVNMSSVQGRKAAPEAIPYSVAKAGIISATKSLAVGMAPHNIRVNAMCPGVIEQTGLYERIVRENPDYVKGLIKNTPMRRPGQLKEIVAVVLFLASDESSYMTGQSLSVDGGLFMP